MSLFDIFFKPNNLQVESERLAPVAYGTVGTGLEFPPEHIQTRSLFIGKSTNTREHCDDSAMTGKISNIGSALDKADMPGSKKRKNHSKNGKKSPEQVEIPEMVGGAPEAREIILQTLNDIKTVQISWAVPGLFPRGVVSVLAGEPATGKSFLAIEIAAKISVGGSIANGSACLKGKALLFCGEDSPHRVKERLHAGGADIENVVFTTGAAQGADGSGRVNLINDLPSLEMILINNPDIEVVVFDTLHLFMSSSGDKATQCMADLQNMAECHNVAIIALAHLTKTLGSNAINSVRGCGEIIGVSRNAWMMACDPNDTERRLLTNIKSNLVEHPLGRAFRLIDGRVEWEEEMLDMTADDVMAAIRESKRARNVDRRVEKYDPAVDFMTELLTSGPVPVKTIEAEGKAAGFTQAQLRYAFKKLGGRTQKATGKNGGWMWILPGTKAEVIQVETSYEPTDATGQDNGRED